MPGAMNKQNQRQAQKRKKTSTYGFKKIRAKTIPLVCRNVACNLQDKPIVVPSQSAYITGGNRCKGCGKRMSFGKLPPPQLVKA